MSINRFLEIFSGVEPEIKKRVNVINKFNKVFDKISPTTPLFFYSSVDTPTIDSQPFIHKDGVGKFQESLGVSDDVRTLKFLKHHLFLSEMPLSNPDGVRFYRFSFGGNRWEVDPKQREDPKTMLNGNIDFMPKAMFCGAPVEIAETHVYCKGAGISLIVMGNRCVISITDESIEDVSLNLVPIVGSLEASKLDELTIAPGSIAGQLIRIVNDAPKDVDAKKSADEIEKLLLRPLAFILDELRSGHLPAGSKLGRGLKEQ